MGIIFDAQHTEKKLKQVIEETNAKRVLIFFWHGLGDLCMFLKPFQKFKETFPSVHFDIGIVKGIGQEEIVENAIGFTTDADLDKLDYDVVAKINFPMSEGQEEFTKGEWCCIHELGIDPTCGHSIGDCHTPNRLVGVHFNITCLPGACNPDRDIAELIWNEILEAGMIPIETHFKHVFHNPVNEKFDFVDCTVRRVQPRVSTLTGLISQCRAFIGVVSGNFHVAMSVLPNDKVMLLEKDFTAPMFTKQNIARCDIKNYQKGKIKEWLLGKEFND